MSDRLDQLDLLARDAAADLETATTSDPGAGLSQLYSAQTRHRSQARIAVAAVLVVALAAGWFGHGALSSDKVQPVGRPTPSPSSATSAPPHVTILPLCQRIGVRCEGSRTYRLALAAPVRWHVGPRFQAVSSGPTDLMVESYWVHDGRTAGVTVAERVRPSTPTGSPLVGFGESPSPHGFAQWLAGRSDLTSSRPEAVTLDGRPAWRVQVSLAPSAGPGTFSCSNTHDCHPVTFSTQGVTGIWGDMVAQYTFVRVPGGGTTMVWSWAFGHDTAALTRAQSLVDGVSWPAR